jgi:hypothetical protein
MHISKLHIVGNQDGHASRPAQAKVLPDTISTYKATYGGACL